MATGASISRRLPPTAVYQAIWWPCVVGAILILQVSLILLHEPFVDEWQALQIAVQSPTLADLLYNLRYEGHPPLWHLFLRAVAAVFAPAHALAVASLVTAGITQCIILFRGPFPRWARAAIALGEPVLFEFGTVSRGYSLGMAIMFLCALLWSRRRLVWLPIMLLPIVESFFGLFSIALIAALHTERRIWWPGLAAWAICSGFAAWTVIPAADFISAYKPADNPPWEQLTWLFSLSSVFLPLQWNSWNTPVPLGGFLILWVPFLYLCWDQTRGRLIDAAGIALFLLATLAYVSFLYGLGLRHMLLLSLLIICLEWRHAAGGEPLRPAFKLWIALGAACGLLMAVGTFTVPFDTAGRARDFITKHKLQDATWVSVPAQHGQGISAATGILFEGPESGCRSDFMRWNFRRRIGSSSQLTHWIDRQRPRGRFMLLSEFPLEPGSADRLLAHIPYGYDGKQYYIYEIASPAGYERPKARLCVQNARPLSPGDLRR